MDYVIHVIINEATSVKVRVKKNFGKIQNNLNHMDVEFVVIQVITYYHLVTIIK